MERDRAYLLDMLDPARLALSYVAEVTLDQFMDDFQCQDAVIRRIVIVGEAARRISPETRETLSSMRWREIIGMRNLLIHNYDDIDVTIVWDTVQVDLPQLIQVIGPLFSNPE